MKTWLKGGLISLVIGYIGYTIVYLYMKYRFLTLPSGGDIATMAVPGFIGSIAGLNWFIIYSLIFFIIGAVIGLIIQKFKK